MQVKALAFIVALLTAPPALRLDVTPTLAIAPQDLHVRVFVTRDAANRWLEVRASGEQFETASEKPIEGEFGPAIFDWLYLALPCGTYIIRASLRRSDGNVRAAQQTARYLGAACAEID